MLQKLKNKLKDQRGLTLIELLAVIVILGIIAAIAVPSILGLIDNSKKDAHVANAEQMISSAKMAVADNIELQTETVYVTLEFLEAADYIDAVKDPDKKGYLVGTLGELTELPETEPTTQVSYVEVVDGKVTKVKLVNSNRGVQAATSNDSVDLTDSLSRKNDVNETATATTP